MEAVEMDPLDPLTEEEKDWWRRFRHWLEEMEIKRMTWQDTIRHMAELRELNPDVVDLIETNNGMARGDIQAPEGINLIEATATDIKAILDYEKMTAEMLRLEAEKEAAFEAAIANALDDYYKEPTDD